MVGGSLTYLLSVRRGQKAGGVSGAYEWIERFSWMVVVYGPAALLVLATGVTMVSVNDAWRFSQSWVYGTLILVVVISVVGGGNFEKKMKALHAEGKLESPEFAALLSRTMRSGWVGLAGLVLIVALMVYKPGA